MVNLGNAAVAVTEYTRNACFASPADFPATLANAALSVPTWWMLIITVALYTLSIWHREPYLFMIGVAISLSQYITNPLLQAAIKQPPPFPGCGGHYGDPNAVLQTLALLITIIVTFPFFYDARRLSPWKQAVLVGAYSFSIASLIALHYATPLQLFHANLVGIGEGLVFQIVVFLVFFPAIELSSRHLFDYVQIHGLARWIGAPVAWLLYRLGYQNGLLDSNTFWATLYDTRTQFINRAARADNAFWATMDVNGHNVQERLDLWFWLWNHDVMSNVESVMYNGIQITPESLYNRVVNAIVDDSKRPPPTPMTSLPTKAPATPVVAAPATWQSGGGSGLLNGGGSVGGGGIQKPHYAVGGHAAPFE